MLQPIGSNQAGKLNLRKTGSTCHLPAMSSNVMADACSFGERKYLHLAAGRLTMRAQIKLDMSEFIPAQEMLRPRLSYGVGI